MLQLNYSLIVIALKLIVANLVKKFTVCKTVSFITVFTSVHPKTSHSVQSAISTPHIQF